MIKEKINNDLHLALKSQNKDEISALRNILSELNVLYKSGKNIQEQDEVKIIKKQIKQLDDAIKFSREHYREDLSEKNIIEQDILIKYLPTMLSEEEIRNTIKSILINHNEEKHIGKLTGICMKELKGKADGNIVNKIITELINNG